MVYLSHLEMAYISQFMLKGNKSSKYEVVIMPEEQELPTKKFTRTIEDFSCDHCGFFVRGTGYTNHCPKCLWSKHVDINPGDRAGECGGLMEPISVEIKEKEYVITQQCIICNHERKNSMNPDDDLTALIELSTKIVGKA